MMSSCVKHRLEGLTILGVAVLASLATLHLVAAAGAPSELSEFSAAPVPNDQQELESFLDSVMADAMQRWQVPGAVILLVQGDAVVFSKGYGYADLERQIPVTPDTTVFHMFSLSKLLTATAIMQLAEQGKVDLDRDVNTYLAHLRISDPYPQPITIGDLLTHTAGLDNDQREIGGSARSSAEWLPLDRYLAKRGLAPMWPPGPPTTAKTAMYATPAHVLRAGGSFVPEAP
jgi:CubicO group peptidase (beta-lactamase class C family)